MPPTLQARFLGEFALTYDDQPIAGTLTGRSQALLAYLMLRRHTPQLRQRLAFHLWSESTDTQARTNLRKELSQLRRALPDADRLLLVDAKTLQWQPNAQFTLDVVQFEEAIKIGQTVSGDAARIALEQALAFYQGDLLPDFEDDWILPERERLQQLRVRTLEQLIDQLEAQQNYRSALDYAQQLLRLDSLNEAVYCTLMRLHGLNGDRANALQVYYRCMTLLREELGVDPGLTTRKLYEQLLEENDPSSLAASRSSLSPSASAFLSPRMLPLRSPLVGRQAEWEVIQRWAIEPQQDCTALNGSAEVLLLLGEPGIGKTRLLEELRAKASQMQATQVVWGRAFAAEMVRPYGIWIDALRSIAIPSQIDIPTELGFLLPEMDQSDSANSSARLRERSHLFDAVVQLFAQWGDRERLIIILDDIQWIDEASSALLHYAIRLLSHLPILFACTSRSQELAENVAVSRVVQALRREQRLRTLELQPFDRSQTAELIRHIPVPHPLSTEVVDRVFVDSGGNPLFALEVARALSQDHSTQGNSLEALIGDRLQHLDDVAREILPWAAALGRSFKTALVAHVADYPLTKLLMAIEQLERQTIIRPSVSIGDETGYDFSHDIVRQVVYHQLSEPRRRLIHLQIAHRLNQLSSQNKSLSSLAGEVAHHAALGGDPVLAASTALSAAQCYLKLFAYAEALEMAQRGIPHCQRLDDRTRIRMHLGLLRVCAIAGVTGDRVDQLDHEIQHLLQETTLLGLKDEEALGLEALGILHFNHSNFADLHQTSLRAVEASRAASPATAAKLLAYSGSCLAEIGQDMARAEALLLEAQSLAARVGLILVDISSGMGCIHYHHGNYGEAKTLIDAAWRQAQAEQDHWREFECLRWLVMIVLEMGDPAAALPYCHRMAIVAAKTKGEGSEGAIAAALEALANYRLQQPDAEPVLAQAIATLKLMDAKRMLSYVLIGAAEVDLECGRPALATVRAEAALQAARVIAHTSEISLAWAISIQGALALGERERATAQFEALRDQIDRHALSTYARAAVDRAIQQIQGAVAAGKATKNA